MELIVAVGVLALVIGLGACQRELKRMADVAERRERMDREHYAIMNSIGTDIARNTERG